MEVRNNAALQAIRTSVALRNNFYDAIKTVAAARMRVELIPPITVVPNIARMRGFDSFTSNTQSFH